MPAPTITVCARSRMEPRCYRGVLRLQRGRCAINNSAQIDYDRLELGQAFHREPPADPPDAAPRAGAAAERQVRLPVVRPLVHVHPPGPDRLGEAEPAAQIAREDRGEQPVLPAV